MKWLLTAVIILTPCMAWPQFERGTVIFINFSHNEVTVAADSRSISSQGTQTDNECKISAFGQKFAFTMTGMAHRDGSSGGTTWNAHSVAREVWKKESLKYANDAFGLVLATERDWTTEMKVFYSDPKIISFRRNQMKLGDDPILASAFFIATDSTGKLIVHGVNIEFDVTLYDSKGRIAVSESDRITAPEDFHITGGHDEIINEFWGKTSSRAKEYMAWFNPTIANLPESERNARFASKMIELSILLHPDRQELGFPIDLIQMRRKLGVRVLSMKKDCSSQQAK